MYAVTGRIAFCYGHRLLDYGGVCKHLHGHNAEAEVEVRAATLDGRGMVVDFVDITRPLKAWVDREIDHKMILRRDDPLADTLEAAGEPVYRLDSNPTVERLARLLFAVAHEHGLPVVRVTVWESPGASATYSA